MAPSHSPENMWDTPTYIQLVQNPQVIAWITENTNLHLSYYKTTLTASITVINV